MTFGAYENNGDLPLAKKIKSLFNCDSVKVERPGHSREDSPVKDSKANRQYTRKLQNIRTSFQSIERDASKSSI